MAMATPAGAQTSVQPLAGPNLDGDAYSALRENAVHEVLTVTAVAKSKASSQTRALTIGPDFVLEQDGDTVRLYDFRFRRLLTLNPDVKTFTNESLYGHARTRFAFLQNNLSTGGIGIGAGLVSGVSPAALRFANEHLNGMDHPADVAYGNMPKPELVLRRDGSALTGVLKGAGADDEPLLTATIGRTGFPSEDHARSFQAWLAWGARMHPQTAAALVGTGRVPDAVSFAFPAALRKLNPNLTRGQALEFRDAARGKTRFDILRGWSAKLPAWEPYLPEALVATMVAAANGTAPNGPASDEDFITEIGVLLDTGQYLDAALVGLHASHPYDGCQGEHRARQICTVIKGMMNKVRTDRGVRILFTGFAQEQQRNFRGAAQTWVKLRILNLARLDILDFMIANALVEAQKKSPLEGEMGVAFGKLPELFTRSLAADPYDPARYRDIFNYLHAAATGLAERYTVPIQAQALIDLAQALPDRLMPRIITQIVEANDRIAGDYPLLFPVFPNP